MIHYLAIDTNPQSPKMYDSRIGTEIKVQFDGARSFLHEYINKLRLEPISIYESELPPKPGERHYRTQIMCWYRMPTINALETRKLYGPAGGGKTAPMTLPATTERINDSNRQR